MRRRWRGWCLKRWIDDRRRAWGEGSPLWAIRVLGEFSQTGDDTVCGIGAVEAAQARRSPPGSPVVVACDVARFGSDETVVAVRRGPRVRIARAYHGRDLMGTVGEIIQVARAERAVRPFVGPVVIVVDDAGLGGGVVDRLRELGEFQVRPFLGAERAIDQREYPRRRDEAWFAFAEQLDQVDLDRDEQLAADLVSARYSVDSRGRRAVEAKSDTKRRLGRSPDRADAVLMAFSVRLARPAPSFPSERFEVEGGYVYGSLTGDLLKESLW